MEKKNLTPELIQEYTRVAYYYYKSGLTQDEIAKRLNMSRQRVNRIIGNCIDYGIIEINIVNLNKSHIELEARLEQKYRLKDVRIIENVDPENIYVDLGKTAGQYLASVIKDGDIIAFSRGRCTSALADHMPSLNKTNITVTQLLGNDRKNRQQLEVDSVVYRFSEKLNATPHLLYAPIVVGDESFRQSLIKEDFFANTYNILRSCNIAVVGIGTAQSQWKHMAQLCDLKKAVSEEWASQIVGEVATHFFDAQGQSVSPPFRNRIIAIELEDYLNIPLRIGIAGQSKKLQAIKAALEGGYVNALITDLETATQLE